MELEKLSPMPFLYQDDVMCWLEVEGGESCRPGWARRTRNFADASALRIGFWGGCMYEYDQNLQRKVGIWFGEGESFRCYLLVNLHMPKEAYETIDRNFLL